METIQEIIKLTFLLLFIEASARVDYETLKRYFIHNHTWLAMQRFIFIVVLSIVSYNTIIDLLFNILSYSIIFGVLFDKRLNILRGNDIFHLGSTAKWDVFWSQRKNSYIAFSYVGSALAIYLLFFV